MVPPDAAWKAPLRLATAPVKAPRSCPNSSLSSSWGGMAPQSTMMKGPFPRSLSVWIDSAVASLPVPVSPSISTVASLPDACSHRANTARIAADRPTMLPKRSRPDSGIPAVLDRWNRIFVVPTVMMAPSSRGACATRTPLTTVPFLLPRSRTEAGGPRLISQ